MEIKGVAIKDDRCCVVGIPDESHDCDMMGCSSVEHVLWRGSFENETKLTDDEIIKAVYQHGGTFHGPNIEHVSMEEQAFCRMVRSLVVACSPATTHEGTTP